MIALEVKGIAEVNLDLWIRTKDRSRGGGCRDNREGGKGRFWADWCESEVAEIAMLASESDFRPPFTKPLLYQLSYSGKYFVFNNLHRLLYTPGRRSC